MIDTEVHGLEEAQANMDRRGDAIRDALPDLMTHAVLYVQGEIPPYPSPPPGSTYQRTGTLGRIITAFGGGGMGDGVPLGRVETIGGGAVGYIGGRLDYIGYVVGEGEQAAVHSGRWYTLQGVLRGARDGVVNIFREGIRALLR